MLTLWASLGLRIKSNGHHFFSIGIPLLLIPFLYSNRLLDPVLIPKFLAFAVFLVIYGIATVYRLFNNREAHFAILRTDLVKYFVAYFIISAGSLTYSVNVSEGLFEVAKIGLFLIYLILLLIQYGQSDDLGTQLAKYVILFSTVAAIAGLAQYTGLARLGEVSHLELYDISVTFAHKNLYSQVLLLSLPFALYGVLVFRSFWRLLSIVCSFLSLCLITVLLSRAAWIALATGGCATLVLWMIIDGAKYGYWTVVKKSAQKTLIVGGILLIAISVSVLAYSKLDTVETIRGQIASIGNIQHSSTKDRISLWKKSLQLAEENPLLGAGTGSWKIQINKTGTGDMRSIDGATFFQRPHNDFLWILSETGLVGLLASALIILTAMRYIRVVLKEEQDSSLRLFTYFVFFGIVEYLAFSFFSFPKERYEPVLLLCMFLVPLTLNYSNRKAATTSKVSEDALTGYSLLGVLVLAACLVVVFGRFQSEAHAKLAFKARSDNDWKKVVEEVDLAESSFYRLDPTSTPLRWYSGSAQFNMQNFASALTDFQKAYEIHPYHIHVLNNLASTYIVLNQPQTAMDFYDKAIAINPGFRDAHLNKAIIYYNGQQVEQAYSSLREIQEASNDFRHSILLLKILIPRIDSFLEEVGQRQLKMAILSIRNDEDWVLSVHFKSVVEKRPFEYQLFLDGLYVLEIAEKSITFDQAAVLKLQYVSKFNWL